MRYLLLLLTALSLLTTSPAFAGGRGGPSYDNLYKLGPDSMVQEGVPQGKVVGPLELKDSKAYPGTLHTYWIYVPAQYDPSKPANLMIFQDGHAYLTPTGSKLAPVVYDNLIYRRELPVTIAIFINPGHTAAQPDSTDAEWGDRVNNRPTEYNVLDDKYAHVILDELLPEVKKSYNISEDPKDRGLGGESSGAIAAFTVAWHRPDKFSKVLSTIGSFTAIRGGDAYPQTILDAPAKPIRIFLQDGLNDNRSPGGRDWHGQNIKMVEALTAKKYDVNFEFGLGTHNGTHGGAILPQMLRWLWRDYPRSDDAADRGPLPAFVPKP